MFNIKFKHSLSSVISFLCASLSFEWVCTSRWSSMHCSSKKITSLCNHCL